MPITGGLLTNRTVLLAKIESTYGTDSTPATSANEIEVFDVSVKPVFEKIERKPLRASLSPLPMAKSKKHYEISFTTELKNGGTAGTPGRLSPLFQSCGLTETDAAGSDTYTPGNPSGSCTIWVYKDGLIFKAQGCRGNLEIVAEAGKIAQCKWTFKGIYNVPVDGAMVTPTYESTVGVALASTATAISGFAGNIRSYSINLNNNIVDRPSINSANGMVGFLIGSRQPSGKVLMEAELIATEPIWTEFNADTVVPFTSTIGSTAGNIVTITASTKTQYADVQPTDENGIFMYDIDLAFSGTDDELSIALT